MEHSEKRDRHVLFVEDDPATRELVVRALSDDGYTVEVHGCGDTATRALLAARFAAVVLDLRLPDCSGIELCRAWRRRGERIPVLMLTALTDVSSRVAGLNSGADDYLGKPFALAELKARLSALLRRGARSDGGWCLRRGDVTVDFQRRLAWVAGLETPITRREIDVLARLAAGAGAPVSRDELLEELWGEISAETAASLDVIVSRLRRKLEGPGRETLIRTVRGQGYALHEPPDGERS